MSCEKRFFLFVIVTGFSLMLFGCTSAMTKQTIQGDYEYALKLFNKLPANAKECAPQEYAKTEATLAHIQEEIDEQHWRFARKYISMADAEVRDTKSSAKRRCKKKPKSSPPPVPPSPPAEAPAFILEGITFDFNKESIRPASELTLKEAGMLMQRFGSIMVKVEGHTDSVGAEEYNQGLSERRANSVKDYLVNNFEIDSSRIDVEGLGETSPVADNSTDEGRAGNRRIEFLITAQ
jgi:outer membrane protein OmpA-like peptidoglycan-associated protein